MMATRRTPNASRPPDPSEPPSGDKAEQRVVASRVSAAKCVRCGKPVQARYRPFCSRTCAEIDLGGWLTERYRVATEEPATEATSPDAGDAGPADEE